MRVGLSKRHSLEDICEDFVFDAEVEDPLDFKGHRQQVERFLLGIQGRVENEERLRLYVTGLAPLLAAFLHVWAANEWGHEGHSCGLILMHWNRETETYEPDDWNMGFEDRA
jgi:hypothetical protein